MNDEQMIKHDQEQDQNQARSQTQTEVRGGPAGDGKKPYFVIDPGPLTCKTDIAGLEFDFNYGLRVKVPEGDWRVKFTDRDAGVTLYDARASDVFVTTPAAPRTCCRAASPYPRPSITAACNMFTAAAPPRARP